MEIKSSLLNDDDFKYVKESLISVSEIDHKENFRVKALEYINDTSDTEEDIFFYDMMEFIRFLNPDSEAVAYTTPEHLVYLNCPGHIGENVRQWDFIYDHECLHQLWDTFAVGDKIKEKLGADKYDHTLLNIASDCVINDYLSYYRKKTAPNDGVTPEYIKNKYNVIYDRKVDTQYTLYIKLLEVIDKIKKDKIYKEQEEEFNKKIKPKSVKKSNAPTPPPMPSGKHSDDYKKGWKDAIQDVLDEKVDPLKASPKSTSNKEYDKGYNDAINNIKKGLEKGLEIGSGSSNNNDNSDLPQIPWEIEPDDSGGAGSSNTSDDSSSKQKSPKEQAQDAAKEAQDAAKEAQDAADKAKEQVNKGNASKSEKKAAEDAQAQADKAKKAAEDAKEAADKGDDKAAKEAAKNAKDAADKAKKAAKETGADIEEGSKDDDDNDGSPQKGKPGKGHVGASLSDIDLQKLKEKADKIIDKYKNKISGDLGTFISKCKKSVELKESGLAANTSKGMSGWNQQMNSYINAFVKKKVFQKKREYQSTYSRIKRGSGFIKYGQPINPGKKIREEKLTINVAFYIDRSGSMSGSIDNVFKATYTIAESLKKQFDKETVVDDITFKIFAFDDRMITVPFGKTASIGGGTMPFHQILDFIKDNTYDYLINVIITDAQFDINENETDKFIKNINGLIEFITNVDNPEMKAIAKKYNTQMNYILADNRFRIK